MPPTSFTPLHPPHTSYRTTLLAHPRPSYSSAVAASAISTTPTWPVHHPHIQQLHPSQPPPPHSLDAFPALRPTHQPSPDLSTTPSPSTSTPLVPSSSVWSPCGAQRLTQSLKQSSNVRVRTTSRGSHTSRRARRTPQVDQEAVHDKTDPRNTAKAVPHTPSHLPHHVTEVTSTTTAHTASHTASHTVSHTVSHTTSNTASHTTSNDTTIVVHTGQSGTETSTETSTETTTSAKDSWLTWRMI
jgi:mucin-2